MEHLPFVYFNDVNHNLNPKSSECIEHVRPYYQLATDLANHTSAQYNFITPNLCHDGHEGISPGDALESKNTRCEQIHGCQQNVPLIIESDQYKQAGALFIIWNEGEDSGAFSDGPIGMFLLSPFVKGGGKRAYSNSIPYDHSSTLKTLQDIFKVSPLSGAAAHSETIDLV